MGGFNLSTAKPVAGDQQGKFDISTAQPIDTSTGGDFIDRAIASIKMTNEGKVGYLEAKNGKGTARLGADGEIQVKKNGRWTQFDEKGFGVGDIADFVGDVPSMVGSTIGAIVGAPAAGVGGVAGAAAGGAAGAAVRQGISALLPGDDKMSAAGRVGDVAMNAAFSGAGQKVGNMVGQSLAKSTARELQNVGSVPTVNITMVENALDNTGINWRTLSSAAQQKAKDYAARAIDSGAEIDPRILTNKALLESLPVPINTATKGQLSRDFVQQQNENMLADIPVVGKQLRTTFENQQPLLADNLDAILAKTGAKTVNPREVGQSVQGNLLGRYGAAKDATKAAYSAADAADGAMPAKVSNDMLDWLDKYRGFQDESGVLTLAKKLGIVTEDASGKLSAGDAPLRNLYELRKAVSAKSKTNGNLGGLKSLIDDSFDNSGSSAYQAAAALRRQQGQTFEQGQKVISDLVKTKSGSTDLATNPEDLFNRVVLNGTKDDIRNVKRMLLSGNLSQAREGFKTLKNLRGATVDYLRNASIDDIGGGAMSFKTGGLQRAVDRIGMDNLNELLGKESASQVRSVLETSKIINKSMPNRTVGSATAPRLAAMAMNLFDTIGKVPGAGAIGSAGKYTVQASQGANAVKQPTLDLLNAEAMKLLGNSPNLQMLMSSGRLGGVALAPDDYR